IETPYDWIDASLRVGVFGGNLSGDRGSLNLGPGSATAFGARLRTRVSSPLSLEIGFGFGGSDRAVIDPRLPTGPAAVDTVDADWLLIEGGFQIALTGSRTLHKLQPYVVLTGGVLKGLGEVVSDSLMAVEDTPFRYKIGTASVFTAGAGVEWLPNGRIGLGIELRDHLWRIKAPDGFFQLDVLQNIEDLGLRAPQESEWTHNVELSASLYYYF
ncbi:MAG: hypothetical protein OEM96_02700, partial [Gemmatimonadota bacterium]|nr:hypothetical protein [Gemmatimonadota bacterium]